MQGQKPTVGRIVLFNAEGGPYPALVTAVNADGTLELCTFGRNSVYFNHNVPECEDPMLALAGWYWPPRQ